MSVLALVRKAEQAKLVITWAAQFAVFVGSVCFLLGCSEQPGTERKARLGDADAQFDSEVVYYSGDDEEQAETVNWYRKSAEQGNAGAQFNLGAMYYSGKGVEKDFAEALKWSRKAADQGHAKAYQEQSKADETMAPSCADLCER